MISTIATEPAHVPEGLHYVILEFDTYANVPYDDKDTYPGSTPYARYRVFKTKEEWEQEIQTLMNPKLIPAFSKPPKFVALTCTRAQIDVIVKINIKA